MRILALSAAVFIFLLSLLFLYASWSFQAAGPAAHDQFYMFEKGAGVKALSADLVEKNLINNEISFLLFAVLTGEYKNLQAGEYFIKARTPMVHILYQLSKGKVYKRFVTIPEGKTSFEIIRILNAAPFLTGEVVVIPAEGTLLPDTYDYTRGDTRAAMIARMQNAMTKLVTGLMASQIPPHPLMNVNEILTLASIVEKETGQKDERARVAGVFLNRLNKNMRLETDPTVIYGITMGHHDAGGNGPLGRRLFLKDLQTPNPYNTYLNAGLPPTPIANAGRASIMAVFNPELHDYLFFVADGTGGHTFAKTYSEHLKNVDQWRAVRKAE